MPPRDLDEFTTAARAFLDGHARPRAADRGFVWGEGDDFVGIVEEGDPDTERAAVEAARAWAAVRYDAGFGWLTGPVDAGGAGLGAEHLRVYRTLEAGYDVADQSIFTIGLGMVAPTIAAHGIEEIRRRFLVPLHRGDVIACQLFSEPGAGSDLASLSTSAVRDGDSWVVNGQKVWTSNAHHAQIGEIICRTDPAAAKHAGMTGFLVDMDAPGVEVRPLRQMTGGAGFNEVYFDDVRIPDAYRLGEVGAGWSVALTTLMNERASIGSGMGLARGPGPFERLVELVRVSGLDEDRIIRDRLARLYVEQRVIAATSKRAQASMRAGRLPGPELSILKLAGTRHLLHIADFVAEVLGPKLCADVGEWGTFAWTKLVCGVPGARLGGGTDEIIANIIGERVLGLPREPKPNP
ncbi:MAG: acyl-CoA dehydrogenase family protein [Microthrixaceae bacterium]